MNGGTGPWEPRPGTPSILVRAAGATRLRPGSDGGRNPGTCNASATSPACTSSISSQVQRRSGTRSIALQVDGVGAAVESSHRGDAAVRLDQHQPGDRAAIGSARGGPGRDRPSRWRAGRPGIRQSNRRRAGPSIGPSGSPSPEEWARSRIRTSPMSRRYPRRGRDGPRRRSRPRRQAIHQADSVRSSTTP